MTTMASQITSLTVVYSTVYSGADQGKHQSSASLAFVWGIHRDWWIPRTKGQLRGKCLHLMTSSWVFLPLWLVITYMISRMTLTLPSWHGNALCVTDPLLWKLLALCYRWISITKSQWCGALMFYFIVSLSTLLHKQLRSGIFEPITLIWRSVRGRENTEKKDVRGTCRSSYIKRRVWAKVLCPVCRFF